MRPFEISPPQSAVLFGGDLISSDMMPSTGPCRDHQVGKAALDEVARGDIYCTVIEQRKDLLGFHHTSEYGADDNSMPQASAGFVRNVSVVPS